MSFESPHEEIEHLLDRAERVYGSSAALRRIIDRHGVAILTGRVARDATLEGDKNPIGFRAAPQRRPTHG